jgi:phosphoglycolate phosphatase-like HAD superfamily hydrolase
VISDSAPEAFAVAVRTWCGMRPESRLCNRVALLGGVEAPAPEVVLHDPVYAAFVEMMPLGNRAEDYAVELHILEAGRNVADQQAYDTCKAELDPEWLRAFHKRFYRERSRMSEADPDRWQRLMRCYAGIPELLRRHAPEVALAIATSKDRRSVAKLLEAYGVSDLFPEGTVLDKETGVSKRSHFEHLQQRFGFAYGEMTFVDDKLNHLDGVAPLGVRCGLAAWGYNGAREIVSARARGYLVLELGGLEAAVFGGGNT